MQHTNNNTPSLLDFSPVRRLYILFLLAHRNKKSVDSFNEETRDYVYSSLTPSAKRFVEECIMKYTSEPHSTMLRDLLDGEFAPDSVQVKVGIDSNFAMLQSLLWHIFRHMEMLTLLGFPVEVIFREFSPDGGGRNLRFKSSDAYTFLHYYCNTNSDDGWRHEYSELLAEYFSKSDILCEYYRPFIDLVSGTKSIITILAELGCWGIYENYLKQNLSIIEGIAIEKALKAVDLGEVKKSYNYLQLSALASGWRGRSFKMRYATIGNFENMPVMLSRDRNSAEELPEKKIEKDDLILAAEEPLKPAQKLITANSNSDNGNEEAHN